MHPIRFFIGFRLRPVGAYLAERFPTAGRSSGYGVGYGLSIVIPALYPYYLPVLQDVLGQHSAITALLSLGGVLVLVGAMAGPETRHVSRGAAVSPRAGESGE